MPQYRQITILFILLIFALPSSAEMTSCKLTYSLKDWSIIYKNYTDSGTVTGQNNQSIDVDIVAKRGGLTIGKSFIDTGYGAFDDVKNIKESQHG